MEFSEFASIFKEGYQGGTTSLEGLFDVLLCNGLTDEGKKDEVSGYTRKEKENLINGTTDFGSCAAKYVDYFSTSVFEVYLDNLEEDIPFRLVNAFSPWIKGIDDGNYSEKIAELFSDIFTKAASDHKNRYKKRLNKLKDIYDAQDGRCGLCGKPIELSDKISRSLFIIKTENEAEIGVCADCKAKSSKSKKKANDPKVSIDLLIDDELVMAVETLCREKQECLALDYSGLKVSQKIDRETSFDLHHKVSSYVAMYFPSVRDVLEQYESSHPYASERLSSYFKSSFLALEAKGLDQESIFSCLVDNVRQKCDVTITTAETLVSYFIQNCEVFHAIAE